ncbi:sugar kinase [Herbiconiux sp. VKM Ac-1786]|uniref:sugar kinase n=1 Tax=Herbiconiux sp. VKM Ac-1786 TaxID=2783824 RepID=UPI00351BF85E
MTPGYAVTVGETMALFRSAEVGSVRRVRDFELGTGGAESNVAIGLSRLGVESHWIGRVGGDEFGARILRDLRAEGVHVHAVVDEEADTGLMIKERLTSQHTRVTYRRRGSAGSRIRPEDIETERIAGAALLHLSGVTLALSGTARDALDRAVEIARAASVAVSFDVNHRSTLWSAEEAAGHHRRLAARADVLFAGEDEAAVLLGRTAAGPPGRESSWRETVLGLAELGPAEVVLKLGEHGCLALVDGALRRQEAVPITPLDSVGAGDAFVAGYLAERLAGVPVEQRLLTAVRAGALACLAPGDWEGAPTRRSLEVLAAADPVLR